MKAYKLLATDLDGTLAASNKEVSQRTIDTLIEAQKRGLRIVLSSGRPTYGMRIIAEQLQLAQYGGYLISYNGGQTVECSTGRVLNSHTLPSDAPALISSYARSAGFDTVCYIGDRVVSENTSNPYIRLSSERNRMTLQQVPSFAAATAGVPLPKCIIAGDPEPLARLEHDMQGFMEGRVNIFRSDPFLLEVVPEGIDKGAGLSLLADSLCVQAHEVIACGDGFNDITMIQYAGLGVAMANAHPIVKAAAQLITLSNDDDGVAVLVEKLVLEQNVATKC